MGKPTSRPRTDRAIELRDGRTVAFCEWGPSDGDPVALFHGMPGSRMFCPDEEATERAGVRLITLDRPGYGRSAPLPGRTLLGWVEDFVQLLDSLGLSVLPVVGWSSGGPYALACGVRAPDRVRAVGLAAAVGPLEGVPGSWEALAPEVRALIETLRRDPEVALEGVEARCRWYGEDWERILDRIPGVAGDSDDRLLARPEVGEPMRAWFREGARQGAAGYVQDWIAECRPWKFSPADVTVPTHVWVGEQDPLVGPEHGRYLARTIRGARLVTYPGEGHLFPVAHWFEMLAALRR